MYFLANNGSIAQRSPKMTVLMLDACTVFFFNEHPAEGSNNGHGINVQYGEKLEEARNYLFSRACAPNAEAADTGSHITNHRREKCFALMQACSHVCVVTHVPMFCS